jgi:hypothetical protein
VRQGASAREQVIPGEEAVLVEKIVNHACKHLLLPLLLRVFKVLEHVHHCFNLNLRVVDPLEVRVGLLLDILREERVVLPLPLLHVAPSLHPVRNTLHHARPHLAPTSHARHATIPSGVAREAHGGRGGTSRRGRPRRARLPVTLEGEEVDLGGDHRVESARLQRLRQRRSVVARDHLLAIRFAAQAALPQQRHSRLRELTLALLCVLCGPVGEGDGVVLRRVDRELDDELP